MTRTTEFGWSIDTPHDAFVIQKPPKLGCAQVDGIWTNEILELGTRYWSLRRRNLRMFVFVGAAGNKDLDMKLCVCVSQDRLPRV